MPTSQPIAEALLRGPLARAGELPIVLNVRLEDLRARFIPKGRAGRGYRAVARNGRVLLASDRAVEELAGRVALLRIQTWHKRILPHEPPEPFGLLVCVRTGGIPESGARYLARLAEDGTSSADLIVDVGGGRVLEIIAGMACR
jgi:hypothetical protein